jgi:hypothetical protein
VLAYIPLVLLYWILHAEYDIHRLRPYLDIFEPDATRSMLRLVMAAILLIIIAVLRPNLRLLSARSLLLRMGRVDRQAMLGLAAALVVASLGDFVHLATADSVPRVAQAGFLLGVILIASGSMLFTAGLVGIVIDSLRIVPVILRPSVSFQDVLQTRRPDGPSGAAR